MEWMTDLWTWANENREALAGTAFVLWTLVSWVVRRTPTPADDEALAWLKRALGRLSFLTWRDGTGIFGTALSVPGTLPKRAPAKAPPYPE